jgi:TetR/AcrR family transcriptional regulator, mexCD-oprJ operon repressor
VTRSAAIHERVAEAILDAAADLLAQSGESPSMNEVAEKAGVARATLYRYFPSREELLQAVVASAVEATAARLSEADLDTVPVAEGIARVARVVAAGGSKYSVLVGQSAVGTHPSSELPSVGLTDSVEQKIKSQYEALLRRGVADGTLRADLAVEDLSVMFGSLLESAARLGAERRAGVEQVAALVTSVFLRGTEHREQTDRAERDPSGNN